MKVEGNSFSLYEHIISDVSLIRKSSKEKVAVSTYLGLVVIMDKLS